MKTKLMIAGLFAIVLASCTNEPDPSNTEKIAGTYTGSMNADWSKKFAFCEVSKIDDQLVTMDIGEIGFNPTMRIDSVSVSSTNNVITLSKSGSFSGSVDGNVLSWSKPNFKFTGTK